MRCLQRPVSRCSPPCLAHTGQTAGVLTWTSVLALSPSRPSHFPTTSCTAQAWTLYLVSQHEDVERKLCAELDALGLLATPTVRCACCAAMHGMHICRPGKAWLAGYAGQSVGRPQVLANTLQPAGLPRHRELEEALHQPDHGSKGRGLAH